MIVVFQIKNGLLPNYLCNKISYVGDRNPYNVRNAKDIRPNNDAWNTIFCDGAIMYNGMPKEVKGETDFKIFKRLLSDEIKKRFMID